MLVEKIPAEIDDAEEQEEKERHDQRELDGAGTPAAA